MSEQQAPWTIGELSEFCGCGASVCRACEMARRLRKLSERHGFVYDSKNGSRYCKCHKWNCSDAEILEGRDAE